MKKIRSLNAGVIFMLAMAMSGAAEPSVPVPVSVSIPIPTTGAVSVIEAVSPMKVALLDFDNQASVSSDRQAVGNVDPKSLADKGAFVLGNLLANDPAYTLIDRRDFIAQIQSIQVRDGERTSGVRPSFLRAAQAVNADAVLRGSLLSYAPGKNIVSVGVARTEFLSFSLRVALQALDTKDGTVIASAEGVAKKEFRQSEAQQTVMGEDELLDLMKSALEKAAPALRKSLAVRLDQAQARPKIKLSVKTSADPALVEIDGMLIGTSPLKNFQVYPGDHVLTVGKAGHQDVSKQILLTQDTQIEVPMIRTKLSADEMKEILEKSRMNVVVGSVQPALIIDQVEKETRTIEKK